MRLAEASIRGRRVHRDADDVVAAVEGEAHRTKQVEEVGEVGQRDPGGTGPPPRLVRAACAEHAGHFVRADADPTDEQLLAFGRTESRWRWTDRRPRVGRWYEADHLRRRDAVHHGEVTTGEHERARERGADTRRESLHRPVTDADDDPGGAVPHLHSARSVGGVAVAHPEPQRVVEHRGGSRFACVAAGRDRRAGAESGPDRPVPFRCLVRGNRRSRRRLDAPERAGHDQVTGIHGHRTHETGSARHTGIDLAELGPGHAVERPDLVRLQPPAGDDQSPVPHGQYAAGVQRRIHGDPRAAVPQGHRRCRHRGDVEQARRDQVLRQWPGAVRVPRRQRLHIAVQLRDRIAWLGQERALTAQGSEARHGGEGERQAAADSVHGGTRGCDAGRSGP